MFFLLTNLTYAKIFNITANRLWNFFVEISNSTTYGHGEQCNHDEEPYLESETRAYVCPSTIYGRYVTIRFGSSIIEHLQLCEVQVMALANGTECKQTGLACTAGKPQELTAPSGFIASPTMYNVGNYPPNVECVWEITISSNKVRKEINVKNHLSGFRDFLHFSKPSHLLTLISRFSPELLVKSGRTHTNKND